MGETRRNLFKISVLSTFGIVAVPAILKAAQTVGEHRALLRATYPAGVPKTKPGQPADIVIGWEPVSASSIMQLTAYDITPHPSNASLSDVSLNSNNVAHSGKYPIEMDGNHTLNIGGNGAVTNGKEINGLITANAWCEVGSRRGGNSLGRRGHHG